MEKEESKYPESYNMRDESDEMMAECDDISEEF